MNNRIVFGALTGFLICLTSLTGQDREFYKKPTNTPEFWRAIQFEVAVGKYEIAAGYIKELVDLRPNDKDLLALEAKDGLVSFLRLRNVERWQPDRAGDRETRENVEKLIGMVSAALKAELSNPDRITKFAKNLTAPTPEESTYAVKELLRSGIDAIPILIAILQSADAQQRSAILDLLPSYDISAMPPVLAALDIPDARLKGDLMDVLQKRQDYATLPTRVDTDPIPMLWYTAAAIAKNPESLRKKAIAQLAMFLGRDPLNERDKEKTLPQWQLTEIARRIYDHKARFPTKDRAAIWRWDGSKLVNEEKSIAEAEEYYGIRYLKWALEIQPDNMETQRLFINFALDRQFLRSGVVLPLSKSAPGLDAIISTAPYALLTELLETALRENRVAVALVMIQAIGDRAEVKAARPTERNSPGPTSTETNLRPALLMKALDFPDRRVQFAAADAILRMPGPPTHNRTSQIVKILAGALASEPEEKDAKPKAMIADPDRVRAQATAILMRKLGYQVDIVATGRDVFRRMQGRADYELLVVDFHLPYPLFPEFLAQARADIRIGTVPMVVVASGSELAAAHPITLLGRLAVLIAAQEHDEAIRNRNLVGADDSLRDAPTRRFNDRLARFKKLVESVGVTVTPDVLDRLEYFTLLAVTDGELDLSLEAIQGRLVLAPDNRKARLAVLKPKVSVSQPPFFDVKEITPRLAELVALIDNEMSPSQAALARIYWKAVTSGQYDKAGRVIQEPIPAIVVRNPEVENRLKYLTRTYQHVKIIPEVFTEDLFKEELQGFVYFQDPKAMDAAKRVNAQIAMDWLRKMALGEVVGYPFMDAESAIRKALRSKDLAVQAIDVVARMPGRDAQQDLANVVLGAGDDNTAIRSAAASALIKHIQLRGPMLSEPQTRILLDMANTETNPELKAKLTTIQGIFTANAKATGAKLLEFNPAPAAPPPPNDEKKDLDKKDPDDKKE